MSVTAGQVAVKLNLDKTQFEQGMQQARKSVDLLSTAFSSIAALGVGATKYRTKCTKGFFRL